jgi:mono/diheme cytochrome c family protein
MPRLTIAGITLAGSVFVALLAFSWTGARAAGEQVTFRRDVLPILAKHCQSCHSPDQVAPMSFQTYGQTRPWAARIKEMVSTKKMPPVVGTPHYSVLTRGEGLTQAEINTVVKWVDGGAPEGSANDAKSAPPEQKRKK